MAEANPLRVVEIKAFIPAQNFELSKQFYKDLGFRMASEGGGIAYFHLGGASFLLQDACDEPFAPFPMHMLVQDLDAWWAHIATTGIATTYAVEVSAIEVQPWRMRDFCLTDPSGNIWRIGQNIPP
jgi:uncharacterized glyoxalase superfamily protein PhnB